MSLLLLDGSASVPPERPPARDGLVHSWGKVVADSTGIFSPLGLTFFWALYGWRHERQRIVDHLEWLAPKGFDYLRILCEVDWTGRSIEPSWPDYIEILQGFVDCAYDYGLRSELTIVGGREFDKDDGHRRFVPVELARRVAEAMRGREHKVMHYEMCNEWDRLDKVGFDDLIDMSRVVMGLTPPNLVALSAPGNLGDNDHDQMRAATAKAGANLFTVHPRRSKHDNGWSHVRQGYDFKDFPQATSNNEPEGPASSVASMESPLQLALTRALGIVCGGAAYVLHVGSGVTGLDDPARGRPADMWNVDNIDAIMAAVRGVDALLPEGVENWRCVNNGRRDHPLPLPSDAFWEGSEPGPKVNKNYAAISASGFAETVIGVKSVETQGPVHIGTARRACHVEAFDPVTHTKVAEADLAAGQPWSLPGRLDTMAGYIILGHYAQQRRRLQW